MDNGFYHDAIVRAAKVAVGAGRLVCPDASAMVDNPLCGDRVTIDLHILDGRITDIAQEVRGCLLCEAASSILAEKAVGRDGVDLEAVMSALGTLLRCGEVVLLLRQQTWRQSLG